MELITKFGIDELIDQVSYKNVKIALTCNLASVTSDGTHSRLALLESGYRLLKLFTPEHGFSTTGEDGAFMNHHIDEETRLPIISLYSEKLAPSESDLSDIDLVIVDLPDIGSRFYTYLWTMTYILESCEKYNKKVVILDRPNPMTYSIDLAEGPILNNSCISFIGRLPIPVTHQSTFGELAQYFKATYYPKLELEIIKMRNWSRELNNGYNFFPTSPAIKNRETIYTYAGACLFEGLNINEGRGSDYPFAQFGAPWINADLLHKELTKSLSGAILEIVHYTPSISLYKNELCHGIRVIPINPKTFQSFHFYCQIIKIINDTFPDLLKEREYLTNVNPSGAKHLDKLIGLPESFNLLKKGEINSTLTDKDWKDKIKPYLLY